MNETAETETQSSKQARFDVLTAQIETYQRVVEGHYVAWCRAAEVLRVVERDRTNVWNEMMAQIGNSVAESEKR